jgi:hypothetical protein
MIQTTMKGEMEKKRKIHTDTSSRVFQVLRTPLLTSSHFVSPHSPISDQANIP